MSVVMLYGMFATTFARESTKRESAASARVSATESLSESPAETSRNAPETSHLRKSARCTVSASSFENCSSSLSARLRSFSTASIVAPALKSSTVRLPVPGPISKMRSPLFTSAAATASRITEWSMRKCWPSQRLAEWFAASTRCCGDMEPSSSRPAPPVLPLPRFAASCFAFFLLFDRRMGLRAHTTSNAEGRHLGDAAAAAFGCRQATLPPVAALEPRLASDRPGRARGGTPLHAADRDMLSRARRE